MNFNQFLVISDTPPPADNRGIQKAIVNGTQYFEIGGVVPVIDNARRTCLGFAKITEIHVGAKYTIVFYQNNYVENPKAIYRMYQSISTLTSERMPDGTPRRARESKLPGTSTVDPALAMSMGIAPSPRRDDDDDDLTFEDAMRLSGHSGFGDDEW